MSSHLKKRKQALLMYGSFGVILVALVLYIVFRNSDRIQYELPTLDAIRNESLATITIERAGADRVRMKKEGENWLVGDAGYRADPTAVNGMLTALSDFEITDLVSTTQNYERYGLGARDSIVITVRDSENEVLSFTMGKRAPSFNHTYVLLDGDSSVYHAASDLRRVFEKDIDELRDKRVLTFAKDDVVRLGLSQVDWKVQVFKPTTQVSTDAQSAGSPVWTTSAGGSWTTEDVEQITGQISDLRCTSYSDESLSDLAPPLLVIEVNTQEALSLSLYEKTDEGYLATSSQTPYLFFISTRIGDALVNAVERAKEVS